MNEPSAGAAPGWGDIQLLHASLPEIDLDQVDASAVFLGHRLRLPLLIDCAAGGAPNAPGVDAWLVRAAQRAGAGCVVNIVDPPAQPDGVAPDAVANAFLAAALPASLLLGGPGRPPPGAEAIEAAVRALGASALVVRLDFWAAAAQSDTGVRVEGCAVAIAALARKLAVPVIVQDLGGGMTAATAQRLAACGVAALDAGGYDATRPPSIADGLFRGLALPPAVAVANAAVGLPVIAGAGVRHGLDAARAIACGATLAGVGRALQEAAVESEEAAARWLEQFEAELRTAMFLTGSRTLDDLRRQQTVILGATLEWLKR